MISFFHRLFRALVVAAAAVFFLQIAVAFTGLPRSPALRIKLESPPRYIMVLGGGGIPSETGFMRTYYAARVGTNFPATTFIVSLPCAGDPATNSVGRMRDELVMRGVPRASIELEHEALNTHEQAVNIRKMIGEKHIGEPTLIVTSTYHLQRALRCFEKEGFTNSAGVLAYGIGAEMDFGPAGSVSLRYGIWAQLHAEIDWLREVVATAYYRCQGWI